MATADNNQSNITPHKQSGCLAAFVWGAHHGRLLLVLLLVAAGGWAGWKVHRLTQSNQPLIAVTHNTTIERTPEEIRAIRDIKEWEFLAVQTEELVEHHEAHTFGDKHLVKVFRGTLRIGINMQQADDQWFRADSSACHLGAPPTAILTLPDIQLLDENFIDEPNSTTFYEEGTMSAKAKEALLNKAADAMKARALQPDNMEVARQAARDQFTKIFKALGFGEVEINFVDPSKR